MDDAKKVARFFVILISIEIIVGIIICLNAYIQRKYRSFDGFIEHLRTERANPEVDEGLEPARQEFKDSLETASVYKIKDGDYVESVSVTDVYDDLHYTEWYNTDRIKVTVKMKESFHEDFLIQDKCQMFVSIRDEIDPCLTDLYYSSSYYQLFDKYKYGKGKPGTEQLYFQGHWLSMEHMISYTFYDGVYEYELEYSDVIVTINDTTQRAYAFKVVNGQITEFKDLYKEGLIDSHGNIIYSDKKDTEDSSGSSSGKKDTTTQNGSSYDPYDVHDYDSADDFADDKYEEFYEYEDDYEDEDEAYDAAEDYWYDEH